MTNHVNDVTLSINRGEDYTAEIKWIEDNREPIPVAGPARMEIRAPGGTLVATLDDSTSTAPKAGVKGELLLSKLDGLILLFLSADATKGIPVGSYDYDLFCNVAMTGGIFGNYHVRKAISGRATVSNNVTQGLPTHKK